MPPVIVGIAAGVAAAGVVSTAAAIAIGIGAAALTYAATPKFDGGSFANEAFSQQQMLRSPVEPRRGIYGRAMVSGPLVFAEETGTDNAYLHLVIPLAGHRCDGIEKIYFGDDVAWANGALTSKYASVARIKIHLGNQTTSDPDLTAECRQWTSAHVGFGVTYLYARLKFDTKVFPNGVPNIKALVRGKQVYDPRKTTHNWSDPATWEWSDNWALCCLDYNRFEAGVGAAAHEIDLSYFAAAANDSDQLVEYKTGKFEKRYTCNGTYNTDVSPSSIMEKMLTAGAGMHVYVSGQYRLYAGVYQGPEVLVLTEDDAAGDIDVRPYTPRSDLCNAVRGTFVDPENFYQPTDFPPYESSYYRAQDDGEYIDHDLDLPFTQSVWTAQRLGKLYLEQKRAGMQISMPVKMIGVAVSVGKVVGLSLPRLGIDGTFQIVDWQFDYGKPVSLILVETSPELFDYAMGSYTERDLTPNVILPNPATVPTPVGLQYVEYQDDPQWQGELTWSAPANNSSYRYVIEVSNGLGEVVYQTNADATRLLLPKFDAGFYTVSVWALNLFANRSNAPATITIGATLPAPVTGIEVIAGPLTLTLRPTTAAAIAQTTQFEILGSITNNIADAALIGTGKDAVWPDRHPNTRYQVWARTINNYGASSWYGPVQATTSADNSSIIDLIGNTFKSYTWFAWADDNQGTGFTTVEALGNGKAYMGLATDKPTASPSGNWQDYTWTKIKTEIPPVFTPEEEAKLDNLMAGKLPFAPDKDMLAAQDALNNPALANNLITALSLLNQGINAPALGGETPSGAQSKASSAQSAAIAAAATDATTKANNAKAQAEANAALDALNKANTAKTDAITTAASDATTKANNAKAAAESYALAKANLAETTAKAYADGIVSDEEARAIADAQAKADAAKAAAIATAAADATSKANNAKAQAEANAALDALNKANTAKDEAIAKSRFNLLNLDGWFIGAKDNFGSFSRYNGETTSKNEVKYVVGPFGALVPVWEFETTVNQASTGSWCGGFKVFIDGVAYDPKKSYRFTCWVKRNSNIGSTYLGFDTVYNIGTTTLNGNPYSIPGNNPPSIDTWYLAVVVIHGSEYAETTLSGNTGYWDAQTGKKILSGTEFRLPANDTSLMFRFSQYRGELGSKIQFYAPLVQALDGTETPISAILLDPAISESRAIAAAAADATAKASNAQSAAIAAAATDATTKANNAKAQAEANAALDALNKANTAKVDAISTASTDATTKANNAKTQAISSAATDATTKADAAKAAAIAAAAADATTKANNAKAQAEANAALDALNKVNNVVIGGVNLLIKSSAWGAYTPYNTTPVESENTITTTYQHSSIKIFTLAKSGFIPKGECTLSGFLKVNGVIPSVEKFGTGLASTYGSNLSQFTFDPVTGYFIITQYYPGNSQWIFHKHTGFVLGDVITISKLKFEYGNKATDWSPAPDDFFYDSSQKADAAKLSAIGDIAVGNFAAQTALITTLIANSGLFNQLKSRLGSFGGLTAETIAALAIATNHLQAGAVTVDKVSANAITAEKIAALAIATNHLQAGAVTVDKVGANAITAAKIAALAIATNHLQAGAVTVDKVGANAITAEKIAALAIATNHLQAGAVTADKITADTALIQKLIANVGLFNQLQAQLGVFGGLAANSIAAGAITVDKLDVMAKNLVNNVSQTGVITGWGGGVVVDHIHKGKVTKALEVSSAGNTQIFSDLFDIDHTKIYEVNFTIHRVSGGANGTRYLGMSADGDGYVQIVYPATRSLGSSVNNFYFWAGGIVDGQYRQMRAYIIGSEVDPASIPESLNVDLCCILNPSTKQVRLRALNYYNNGVTTVDRWLNMSVTEIGGGQISANQLLANSALFNQLKAKIGAFGGLTANEIQADTALINKLVGTSGLFNDLVARLAVFGGLTANSIASDAILGRHIKAGEKISSPIIEGGEVRLIGTAFMKVQSATAFGPDGLVEWYGPKLLLNGAPDWANLRKSNAITYLAANGDAYFGGSLSAGVLKTGVTNSSKTPYTANSYPVEIGPFGTNGKPKVIVVSFNLSCSSSQSSAPSGNPTQPQLSWQLQRKIGSGSWATVSSGVFSGLTESFYESEPPAHWETIERCSGSSTYTDNTVSTSDFSYRILVVSFSRFHATANVNNQTLTLISTEQ